MNVGRNYEPYNIGEDDCASMAAFTLPYDLMMDILWLAATAVGSKINNVSWLSGSSVSRACLIVGRNHGGEMEGTCRYEGGGGTCCSCCRGRLNLTRVEGRP